MPRQLTPRQYRSMRQELRFVPAELLDVVVECPACRFSFRPAWLEKRPPLEVFPALNGGQWVPGAADILCPSCQAKVSLQIPRVQQTGGYAFFGDEAHRETGAAWVTTYSLVGTLNREIPLLEERVREVKRRIDPSRSPDAWTIHMKDLWSGDVRARHTQFAKWDRGRVAALCDALFDLVSGYGERLMVVNASALLSTSGNRKALSAAKTVTRNEVYLGAIYSVVDMATRSGVRPRFVVDADAIRKDGTFSQAWASDVFTGAKLNLVFPFLAHGMRIDDPEVVRPGSRPGLELADFASFVIARYLYLKHCRKSVELDPSRLGNVQYIGFAANGDLLRIRRDSYPWEELAANSHRVGTEATD